MQARFFTVAEANAILPRLVELLEEAMQARRTIVEARPELWPVLKKSIGNGGSKKAGEMLPEFRRLEAAVAEIQDLGVHLKDTDLGLVDFLHRLPDGKEVYLCWRYGEHEVAYWHELHAGYAGRKRLN
ncbi:MAG: DUF2203 domain-containing protein [Caldilineae bacterium]|nr:DUF2203 domain-containing protein [Anaerolineae bacterium]MCB0199557.1 DUF2203 domain-containing protein [Anaerolineae bacterium]MCB0204337.1 DUF2203 domain-containing protein [Anaerolineae bacterium]MCB0252636.1 DUF2203 domain-containing protein [Anaerolineae bacterium]MCB9153761.1 DUF2203 domain-containing protein [Caldilineae bacterium]